IEVRRHAASNGYHQGNGGAAIEADHHSLLYCQQTPDDAAAILKEILSGHASASQPDASFPRHSKEPWQIDVYADRPASERYETIRWYLNQVQGDTGSVGAASEEERTKEVLAALETAGLLGMGGAS